MKKKFDGFCIFSDMDGTLITNRFEIPPNNISALEYFTENGGRFALATGRSLYYATLDLGKMLPINMPCILLNGGMIYDFVNEKILYNARLPQTAIELVNILLARYPNHSIAVWCPDHRVELGVSADWMMPAETGTLESVTDPWCKLVIHHDPLEQQDILAFVEANMPPGMETTISCDRFIEIMPEGATKGNAVERLISTLTLERSRVLTIGDYYNDKQMLSLNGVRSYCPDNAPDDIKALCERTLCHVDDGAIAHLITLLDQHA